MRQSAGHRRSAAPDARPGRRALALALGTLAACEGALPVMDHDRYAGLTRDDFRAALEPRPVPSSPGRGGRRRAADPATCGRWSSCRRRSRPAERKLVSLAVNETVPLRDVLIELARKAEVDLELDPRIEGGVILTMRDRPLREVIERIADLAGLRFAFRGTSLRIELDEPYYVNYRIDYLHLTRQANSRVETSVNVMGGDEGTDGNASTSAVSGQSDVNFWQELEASLGQILANSRPREPAVVPAAAPPRSPAARRTATGRHPAGADGAAAPDPAVRRPLLEEAYVAPCLGCPPRRAGIRRAQAQFTINRQAGIVSVFASERQHG